MGFNILYLHETVKISGAEKSLLNLLRVQDRQRFKSYFILPEEGPLNRKLEEEGVKVFVVPMPRIRNIFGVMASAKMILKIAVENDINLVHTNSIRTHSYGTYIAKKKNIPVVWHERNLVTSELIDLDSLFSFIPDKIICNSNAIASRFIKRDKSLQKEDFRPKVVVVYNGVDTERFNPGISGREKRIELGIKLDEPVVGIASRFSRDKGHETFLRSAKIISDSKQYSTKGIRFLITGAAVFDKDAWREPYLRNLTKDLGIEGKVVFVGFSEDMPQIYATMDIFVLASFAEPCGRVILEAMSMGKPVVATNTGGTPEIVADRLTGVLIPPKNPHAMAEAIIYLLKNPEIAKNMGYQGRKRAEENFNIVKNVENIESIYEELLTEE